MSILARLLQFFRSPPEDSHDFPVDPELIPLLEKLATREQRPVAAVIDELLYTAVTERFEALANLKQWETLSQREQQVAGFASLGYTNQQIALHLSISPNTVKTHMRRILYKLNLNSKLELREMLAGWDFQSWLKNQDLS